MLSAGHGVTKKAASALPQLTVQHCAAALWLKGETGKGMQNHLILPTEQSYPLLTQVVGSHVCSESCRKPPNSTWGKEIVLGKKLVLHLGAAWLDTPQPFWKRNCSREGRVTSTALKSPRIAKRQDWLGTSTNNHTGFWSPIFGPPARLGGVSGVGEHTAHSSVNHSMGSQWEVLPV